MNRMARGVVLVLACLLLPAFASGCDYRDPGYSAGAANESNVELVIRDGDRKWLVPPKSAGYMFATLADPEGVEPIAYEILDAETCLPFGQVKAEFWPEPKSYIVIGADLVPEVGPRGARVINTPLEPIEECPGSADGWGIWVENRTAEVWLVRSRAEDELQVAYIAPRSSKLALWGKAQTSTIQLLDRDCNILSEYERTGYLDLRGTIQDGTMTVVPDIPPPADAPRSGKVRTCHK